MMTEDEFRYKTSTHVGYVLVSGKRSNQIKRGQLRRNDGSFSEYVKIGNLQPDLKRICYLWDMHDLKKSTKSRFLMREEILLKDFPFVVEIDYNF